MATISVRSAGIGCRSAAITGHESAAVLACRRAKPCKHNEFPELWTSLSRRSGIRAGTVRASKNKQKSRPKAAFLAKMRDDSGGSLGVALVELVGAATGVKGLLAAGVERVALGADFDLQV